MEIVASTRRTSGRTALVSGSLLLAAIVLGPAALGVSATPNAGSIWTTSGDCTNPNPQDQNQYAIGEAVVIRGSNFSPNTQYAYSISGQPGSASNDPGVEVASGVVTTDSSGFFCAEAYTVAADDGGQYKVEAEGKQDSYNVIEATPTPTPTPTPSPTGGTVDSTDAPTPPPTDTAASQRPTGDGLALSLVGLAAALAVTLMLTPARRQR